jgi:hypothetical protein
VLDDDGQAGGLLDREQHVDGCGLCCAALPLRLSTWRRDIARASRQRDGQSSSARLCSGRRHGWMHDRLDLHLRSRRAHDTIRCTSTVTTANKIIIKLYRQRFQSPSRAANGESQGVA